MMTAGDLPRGTVAVVAATAAEAKAAAAALRGRVPADALVPGYYAAVKPRKKKAVLRAARAYLRALREKPLTVRYDVVEVATSKDGAGPEIRHFENVPLFSKEFLRAG